MADEITVNQSLRVSNGNFSFRREVGFSTFDQTTAGGGNPGTVNIGTSEESVTFGDITTPGWAIMTNLDTTNFVKWGFSTGVYGGRMEPGETAGPFRLDPALASLYMIADTAACNVLIQVLED